VWREKGFFRAVSSDSRRVMVFYSDWNFNDFLPLWISEKKVQLRLRALGKIKKFPEITNPDNARTDRQ
jgi:hypothetical protein